MLLLLLQPMVAAAALHPRRRPNCNPRYTGVGISLIVSRPAGASLCSAARECGDAERFADGGALPSAGCERESECACIIQGWLQPTGVPRHERPRTRPIARCTRTLYASFRSRARRGKSAMHILPQYMDSHTGPYALSIPERGRRRAMIYLAKRADPVGS